MNTADMVRMYRENAAALRRLGNSRPTRNAGATCRAIGGRTAVLREIEAGLIASGHRALVGALVGEAGLRSRETSGRPELQARLRVAARQIRQLAA